LKKIVIVSSGQPSANPRIVKEAVAFSETGYQVKVIYCSLSPWADEFDKKLFSQIKKSRLWVGAIIGAKWKRFDFRDAYRQLIN